ncbi:uncharacterized protein OCT59_009063 [Rhizophagus irregularis]|uniref:uncharacterized protein n=1 Tax=Rhizophagus irregularis TaxID=588596 RepID=UPI00331DB286|nr:hypothetical protein OCT59_009063 [Rhizophagus irregularis]
MEKNGCEIIKSSEIGPVTTNNPGAIYRSRPLSGIIQSAMSTMSIIKMLAVTVILRHSVVCNRLQSIYIKKQKL